MDMVYTTMLNNDEVYTQIGHNIYHINHVHSMYIHLLIFGSLFVIYPSGHWPLGNINSSHQVHMHLLDMVYIICTAEILVMDMAYT